MLSVFQKCFQNWMNKTTILGNGIKMGDTHFFPWEVISDIYIRWSPPGLTECLHIHFV